MAMNGISGAAYRGISGNADLAEKAGRVAQRLQNAESKYMDAIESGNQVAIAQAEQEVKKATRVWESFSRVSEYIHQIIMRLLQKLDAR